MALEPEGGTMRAKRNTPLELSVPLNKGIQSLEQAILDKEQSSQRYQCHTAYN